MCTYTYIYMYIYKRNKQNDGDNAQRFAPWMGCSHETSLSRETAWFVWLEKKDLIYLS